MKVTVYTNEEFSEEKEMQAANQEDDKDSYASDELDEDAYEFSSSQVVANNALGGSPLNNDGENSSSNL